MSLVRLSGRQRSPWFVLGIVCLPVFIGALDLTIISAVLRDVINSLNLPVKEYLDQASWAVNGYLLAYAISMTFAGRLSDLLGRRTIYVACLIIFMVGSYLVTAYDNQTINNTIGRFYYQVLNHRPPRLEERYLYLIIAGRIVQALGAGAMVPITIALVGDLFPSERRAQPLGVVGAVDTMGWVLGHLYGGLMVRLFDKHGDTFVRAFKSVGLVISKPSWETLFILNIPISLLALIAAWWVLRGLQRPRNVGRFDFWGTLFITLALIGFNLGLGTSPESAGSAGSFTDLKGATSSYGLYFLTFAALAFMSFLLIETRVKFPLIRLGMFRNRNVSASSTTNLMVGFCLAIGLVSAPLLVNFRITTGSDSKAALTTGLLLSGLTVPMALAAIPGGWLSERRGYRFPTVVGLLMASIGFVIAGLVWNSTTPYWLMSIQMAVIGIGLGLTISPIGTAVLNDVDENERGVAAALILILRLIGMTIAISSLTTFALHRFDVLVSHYVDPAAVTLEQIALASQKANLKAAADVIAEIQFIGAGVCALALGCALFLRGGHPTPSASLTQAQTGAEARLL